MDNNLYTYLIISAIVGFLAGFILFSLVSPKAKKYNQMKKDLDATLDELNVQRQMMVKHFSHSAEILDNMAKEFRRLYQHMADNSSQFMSNEESAKMKAPSPSLNAAPKGALGNQKPAIASPNKPLTSPAKPQTKVNSN